MVAAAAGGKERALGWWVSLLFNRWRHTHTSWEALFAKSKQHSTCSLNATRKGKRRKDNREASFKGQAMILLEAEGERVNKRERESFFLNTLISQKKNRLPKTFVIENV